MTAGKTANRKRGKLLTTEDELIEAVARVAKALSKRPRLPILGGVLVEPMDGHVRISATDLEVTIARTVPLRSDLGLVDAEPFVVAPDIFLAALRRCAGDGDGLRLSVREDGKTVTVESAARGRRFELRTHGRAKDYPPLPVAKESVLYRSRSLPAVLAWVGAVAATDDTRPVLTSINASPYKNGSVAFMAADGLRLRAVGWRSKSGRPEHEIIIPVKVARHLLDHEELRVGRGEDGTVSYVRFVRYDEDRGIEDSIYAPPVRGVYPPLEKFLTEPFSWSFSVLSGNMRVALRGVELMARNGSDVVRLESVKGGIRVSARAEEIGDAEEFVGAQIVEQDDNRVRFAVNVHHALDAFAGGDRRVDVYGFAPTHPARFVSRITGTEEVGTEIVMPLNVVW